MLTLRLTSEYDPRFNVRPTGAQPTQDDRNDLIPAWIVEKSPKAEFENLVSSDEDELQSDGNMEPNEKDVEVRRREVEPSLGSVAKTKKVKPKPSYLSFDKSKHTMWAVPCQRCLPNPDKCFGPPYFSDGTRSSSIKCHKCLISHRGCIGGSMTAIEPRKSSHPALATPPSEAAGKRKSVPTPKVIAMKASPSKENPLTEVGKRGTVPTSKVVTMEAQPWEGRDVTIDEVAAWYTEAPSSSHNMRSASTLPLEGTPSAPKRVRTSQSATLVPQRPPSRSNNSFTIGSASTPSEAGPLAEDPVLMRLDFLETCLRRNFDEDSRRLRDNHEDAELRRGNMVCNVKMGVASKIARIASSSGAAQFSMVDGPCRGLVSESAHVRVSSEQKNAQTMIRSSRHKLAPCKRAFRASTRIPRPSP